MLVVMRFLSQKSYRWTYVPLDSFFSVVISLMAFVFNDAVWILVLTCILIYERLKKTNTGNRHEYSIMFILSCLFQIGIVLCSTYLFRLVLFIFKHSLSLTIATEYIRTLVVVTSIMEIIFTVITLVLIRKYRQKLATLKINIDKFGIENQILTMTVGTFIALEVIIIISELKLVASSILGVMIVIFTLITSLITYQMIFFIKSYFIRQEAANIRKQNSQLNNYMENIEQQYTEFKKFKHDYNNLLLSLKTLIDGNDSDQLKSYYEELKQQSIVQQTNDAQMMVATDKIDNEPVRGLLIQKFFAAQKLDIKFSIETPETAIKLTNHVVPIVRILGILLDNAIEYVHCHPQYAQAVTCAFINHEHSIELIIENPTSELIDLDQIFELGYSTKGSDHGFGLSNVSELVRQIPNLFINTELKDEKIQISLVLQKEAPFVSHLLT